MAEQEDVRDLGSRAARRGGSKPSTRTMIDLMPTEWMMYCDFNPTDYRMWVRNKNRAMVNRLLARVKHRHDRKRKVIIPVW